MVKLYHVKFHKIWTRQAKHTNMQFFFSHPEQTSVKVLMESHLKLFLLCLCSGCAWRGLSGYHSHSCSILEDFNLWFYFFWPSWTILAGLNSADWKHWGNLCLIFLKPSVVPFGCLALAAQCCPVSWIMFSWFEFNLAEQHQLFIPCYRAFL